MIKGRVLAFGTFDLLHPGHKSYLKQAALLGRELFVLVACDQAVRFAKHIAPIQSEAKRLKQIAKLPQVTKAILGQPVTNQQDYLKPIREFQPEILALGYDQFLALTQWLEQELQKLGLGAKIVRLSPYLPEKYKTSLLKNSIRRIKN